MCLDFHPNCLYLISGSADKCIRVWSVESADTKRLLHGCQNVIRDLACHPKGQILVSASDDDYLRIWDILTSKVILENKCIDAVLTRLQWSKDGNLLCGAFSDKTVKIWNYRNFSLNVTKNLEVLQVINCSGTVLNLEYCFGTFAALTCSPIT
ncbi:hypothetical protein HHI36_016062 [Cryptolaemus montrouzieri]|uniref:Uncharacterized protein n=1 Tax=Cryptolaemus montrouzieri TaxID=559131 RepID=A0ABD2N8Q7_9CUCU